MNPTESHTYMCPSNNEVSNGLGQEALMETEMQRASDIDVRSRAEGLYPKTK